MDHFSPVLPVVVNLRNQGLQTRHWDQIHELIGFEIKGRPEITLGELIEKKVTQFHEEITGVATSAVQEGVLEEMMEKVSAMWEKTEFEVGDGGMNYWSVQSYQQVVFSTAWVCGWGICCYYLHYN